MLDLNLDHLSIEDDGSVLKLAQSGETLSRDQWESLEKLILLDKKNPLVAAVFNRAPRPFLQSVLASLKNAKTEDSSGKKGDILDEEFQQKTLAVARAICRLVAPLDYEAILDICLENLSSSLYLLLYTTIIASHCVDAKKSFRSILPYICSRTNTVSMCVTLSVCQLLRKDPSCEQVLASRIEEIFQDEPSNISKEDFSFVFSAFELFLPLAPALLVPLYCSDSCRDLFLFRGLILDPDQYSEDSEIAAKLLRVISASCISPDARKFNSTNYSQFLIGGTKVKSSKTVLSLSLLCLVKIWNFSALEDKFPVLAILSEVLSLLKNTQDDSIIEPLIEALTYLTLSASLRTTVRNDKSLPSKFMSLFEKSSSQSARYGLLTIFMNLTRVAPPGATQDEQTKNYLKSVAESNKTGETEASIIAFNKEMINKQLPKHLIACSSGNDKWMGPIVQIIYFLTIKQTNVVVSDVGLDSVPDTLLKYLLNHTTLEENTGKTKSNTDNNSTNEFRSAAIKALAALTRALNPTKLFKEYKPQIAVPFLLESIDQKETLGTLQSEQNSFFNSLDLLFGLLALTNLCAIQDPDLHRLVVQKTFDQYLKDFIFDGSKTSIQKAAWELVNNLMESPYMLAKFFNPESSTSAKNLALLIKFLNAEDASLQEIIAGLLANATSEYALVSSAITANNEVFNDLSSIIGQILNEQTHNHGLLYRIGIFLMNLTVSEQAVACLERSTEIKTGLRRAITVSKEPELFREIYQTIYDI